MQEQTYARYALPGVLLVLVIGLLVILVVSGGSGGGQKDAGATSLRTTTTPAPAHRSIAIRAGDSPSTLAERAGIPLSRLLELNPRIDPSALQVGDRLKLVP